MTVNQVRIIEHTMQVRVLFINVDSQQKLELIVQKFRAYLLADFQSPFGCDLTRLEALNEVLRQDCIKPRSTSSDGFKILACLCRIRAATVGEDEPAVVGL